MNNEEPIASHLKKTILLRLLIILPCNACHDRWDWRQLLLLSVG